MHALTTIADLLDLKGRNVRTIPIGTSLPECARRMTEHAVNSLIVVGERDKPVGIVSSRDLVVAAGKGGAEFDAMTVDNVMAKGLQTTTPSAILDDVERMMIQLGIRHLPVLDGGKLVGIVSRIDVLRYYLSKQHALSRELEAYISGVYHA